MTGIVEDLRLLFVSGRREEREREKRERGRERERERERREIEGLILCDNLASQTHSSSDEVPTL